MSNSTNLQKDIQAKLMKLRPGATPSELRNRIVALCEKHKYDPCLELIKLLKEGRKVMVDGREIKVPLDTDEQIEIHKELLSYTTPKLKSIDVQGELDMNITVTVKQFSNKPVAPVPAVQVKVLGPGDKKNG